MAEFMIIKKPKIYKERRLPSENCKKLYRFNEENLSFLCDYFYEENGETRGGALPNLQKLCICLRYLSDTGYQVGVAEDIGCSQATVSRYVSDGIERIVSKAAEWIKFPSSVAEITKAMNDWQIHGQFPSAFMAIDGCLIYIQKPHGALGDEYICRKGFAALNIQATCDRKYRFTSVDVKWPGSVHDARVWRNSQVCLTLENCNTRGVILGDSGYPLSRLLITPFKNPSSQSEIKFNNLHKKERVIIENSFGQVKRRFPILKYGIRLPLEKASKIVVACFVLHNMAKYLEDPDFACEEEGILQDDDLQDEVDNLDIRGNQRRAEIVNVINDMP